MELPRSIGDRLSLDTLMDASHKANSIIRATDALLATLDDMESLRLNGSVYMLSFTQERHWLEACIEEYSPDFMYDSPDSEEKELTMAGEESSICLQQRTADGVTRIIIDTKTIDYRDILYEAETVFEFSPQRPIIHQSCQGFVYHQTDKAAYPNRPLMNQTAKYQELCRLLSATETTITRLIQNVSSTAAAPTSVSISAHSSHVASAPKP